MYLSLFGELLVYQVFLLLEVRPLGQTDLILNPFLKENVSRPLQVAFPLGFLLVHENVLPLALAVLRVHLDEVGGVFHLPFPSLDFRYDVLAYFQLLLVL